MIGVINFDDVVRTALVWDNSRKRWLVRLFLDDGSTCTVPQMWRSRRHASIYMNKEEWKYTLYLDICIKPVAPVEYIVVKGNVK